MSVPKIPEEVVRAAHDILIRLFTIDEFADDHDAIEALGMALDYYEIHTGPSHDSD